MNCLKNYRTYIINLFLKNSGKDYELDVEFEPIFDTIESMKNYKTFKISSSEISGNLILYLCNYRGT